MSRDKALDKVISKLDYDFRKFRKELGELQYVVDLKDLNKEQQKQVTSTLGKLSKAAQGYVDKTDRYAAGTVLVLDRNQFKQVEGLLGKFRSKKEETGRYTGEASQRRVQEFILKQSNQARRRLSEGIARKTAELLKYATPSFRSEFISRVGNKVAQYKLDFNLPDSNQDLQDKLVASTREVLANEIRKAHKDSKVYGVVDQAAQDVVDMFNKGKVLSHIKPVKKTYASKRKVNTKKRYYTPLQEISGIFTSVLKLQAVLNLLLHDTIQTDFMKPSNFPRDKNYLRYQTGRFAKSAKVNNVTQSGIDVNVTYSYMEDPYRVFESSGTNRMPSRIITGAIRKIMVETIHAKFNVHIGQA